ncbi:MAG: helix-turn-helix domain-containing protein [Gemmatimonadota bacterium]
MTAPEDSPRSALWVLCAPYQDLLPVRNLDALDAHPRLRRGSAVVWQLEAGDWGANFRLARDRPAGVSLIMILPPADSPGSVSRLLEAAEQCRPHSVLPFHPDPAPEDLTALLKRVPEDLSMEFMDYLTWRGLGVDQETRRVVRRIVDLSAELKSVTGVARSLYMSRRSLGRRFRRRGLPVPSHVLHFARLLRASLALQGSSRTLFEVARELGYPDGFALSNQMVRLTGIRPRTVRKRVGWEWIVESWLRREASEGSITLRGRRAASSSFQDSIQGHPPSDSPPPSPPPSIEPSRTQRPASDHPGPWRRTARVAERHT